MSILVNKDTKVVTQGITGEAGRLHTRLCREYEYGNQCFVAGVDPEKAGCDFEGIPIYGSVKEAKERTGATVSVIYAPPQFAAAAIDEAVDAEIDLAVCITEGVPERDMVRIRHRMRGKKTVLLGPGSPGVITPGEIKIGVMPAEIHRKGHIGVVSGPGAPACEAVSRLMDIGLGQSTCVGIGGGPMNGLQYIDILCMFNDDPATDAVVMIGEIGGDSEEICARWVRDNMNKPVVAFIAGGAGRKIAMLEECGIEVARNPAEIGELLEPTLYANRFWMLN
jgi:succinyl-CoA synthetase alpha subunit